MLFYRERLTNIEEKLNYLIHQGIKLMATIQDVQTAVAAQTTVDTSVVTLLQNITAQLQAAQASGDPAALDAVVASIQANTQVLSNAVTANTPVAPAA